MVKTKCIYKSKEIIENLYEGYCQLNYNHSNKECSQSVNSTKALMERKAIIAMSGGVDSSVAAFIIKEAGYECMGATMRLYNNEDAGISKGNTCCSLDDIEDARSVAFRIGIPYRVFNFMSDFKENVIDRFIYAYEYGATPNPCIDCNRYLKFEKLMRRMEELEYDYVVTGHYARIEQKDGRYLLKKALDESKDQSYVLYSMTQKQLKHTLFPLGNMTKTEARLIAQKQGFINARKHDSQDICFVPDGDYKKVIKLHTKKDYPCGNFIDKKGNVLGKHKGIIGYTIGQRKGLGLALLEPMYVLEKRIKDNSIVLGKNSDLFSKDLDACDFNWIAYENPPKTLRVKAKVRYRQPEQWCTVTLTGKNSIHLVFDEPQRAIAKGQAVVLYDNDLVVGGGTIC